MSIEDDWGDLLRRVRAGQQQAVADLIHHYEPEIRRFIRARLTNPRLHRILDSADIFQSVFTNFYVRLMAGQFDLDDPNQLFVLLRTMVRNKVIDEARKLKNRKTQDGDTAFWDSIAQSAERPSQLLANAELLAQAQSRLTDEERLLVELRGEGKSWAAIGEQLGKSADGLRKQLRRALDRICRELGLEEVSRE